MICRMKRNWKHFIINLVPTILALIAFNYSGSLGFEKGRYYTVFGNMMLALINAINLYYFRKQNKDKVVQVLCVIAILVAVCGSIKLLTV